MDSPGKARADSAAEPRVAICMATYNPRIELFERQVDSIRGQTHTNWTCLVSDDRSDPERLERLRAVIGDDERFVLSRANEHLGFYRNFERALTLVPADASVVALCDQDDRWHPDKLEALIGALGGANLVYSDQRIVDVEGRVLSGSYWTHRRNNFTDLASLLVANTVTGAALLFRCELLDSALPFPRVSGDPYHDHWLALVALASGDIAYVDRPLYDYVQHDDAQLGHARANRAASRGRGPLCVAALAGARSTPMTTSACGSVRKSSLTAAGIRFPPPSAGRWGGSSPQTILPSPSAG